MGLYFQPTLNDIGSFEREGYLLVKGLFNQPEIAGLTQKFYADTAITLEAYGKRDASGNETKLAVRNELDESPYAAIVRSQRVAETMATLLRDEVYHYHHKMMIKEPEVGGAWEWHQDYGYWYKNGCLYPDMGSCLIALSEANRENGCLQVIRGSQKMGRIDHVTVGDQFQTDPDRVEAALERGELVYCELNPGDALFFHSNLLHRSDANTSRNPRLSLICCYNTRHNDPVIRDGRHPNYSPMEVWPDERVSEVLSAQD
ncbi:MAG: phytanoyl-CoA dioxygenase family protein [Planctomycetota bacterium]